MADEEKHDAGVVVGAEGAGDDKGAQIDPEIVNRASLYGWVPEDQFKGDPKKWVTADKFVERADTILPIAKAMNRKLEGELTMTKAEIAKMQATVKAVIQAHAKTAKGSYDTRLAQIKKDQITAVASGDTETWARLEGEKETIEKPEEIKVEETGGANVANPVVTQWKKDNPWYDTDPELGTYADSVSNFITARSPNLPADEFLDRVKKEVQARFPDKFGNQRRRAATTVDRTDTQGGGDGGGNGKKTYSDLPADAKAACDDLVKQKILTREKYIATYFES